MANLAIFTSGAKNEAGGAAVVLSAKQQLAQFAATGCFNQTFYVSGEDQLAHILVLSQQVDAEFIAKTAVYMREQGFMKDTPALLLAILANRDLDYFSATFPRVVDSGKMLRNVVQIIRSGAVGRRSLGSRPKRLIQNWLRHASEKQLLAASIGTRPSLKDVVKMVHPRPHFPWQEAWFAWLLGRPYDLGALPPITAAFETYKYQRDGAEIPDVPFQMLTALNLTQDDWTQIALRGSWQMVRQNLNTFARHGVFSRSHVTKKIVKKLTDKEAIRAARVFPYQLMSAHAACSADVPKEIVQALETAMELALKNVPTLAGNVAIGIDVSGSMHSSISGWRAGATSVVRCVDVAALAGAALLRKNPKALLLPFDTKVHTTSAKADQSVFKTAQQLAKLCGGGTAVSAPVAWLNRQKQPIDTMIIISDNESWADGQRGNGTALMREWNRLKKTNPNAKLVCIDLQPSRTAQITNRRDVLNVGGFSDQVFSLLKTFTQVQADHEDGWVKAIEAIHLEV